MKPKKILFTLSHAFSPTDGGVQRTTFKLGQYFYDKGFDVYYYSLAYEGHRIPEKGKLFYPGKDVKATPAALVVDVYAVLKKISPDIIINQMPYEKIFRHALRKYKSEAECFLIGCLRNSLFSFKSNAEDIIARKSSGSLQKVLTSRIGIRTMQHVHRFKHRAQLKEILEVHDKFILLTPRNEDELKYFLTGYDSSKIGFIPNSIPGVLSELPLKKKQILFVGNLNVHQKRADLLLPFWKKVCHQLPEWNFVIVGDGDYKGKMESIIQQESIPRVRLLGRTNPEPYYLESSVFIMTSAYEGFPNVLLEAQSHGLASIVVNSYLSLNWIANENTDTLFVPPFEISNMAEKAVALCNDPGKLLMMEHSALKNAGRFTIEKVGLLWLDLFEKNRQYFAVG